MWYFTMAILIFLIGIRPFMNYRKEYEIRIYGFTKFDEDDYVMWLLEWLMISLIFPISLVFIFIIYILKKEDIK